VTEVWREIQLIQDRSAIQQVSGEQMKAKFAEYNLELQEVLIGTPTAGAPGSQIETILTQLRSRQEQVETYTCQEKAAMKEKELREPSRAPNSRRSSPSRSSQSASRATRARPSTSARGLPP